MIMKADWLKGNGFSILKMAMNPLCNPWRNQIGKESTLKITYDCLFYAKNFFEKPKKAILTWSLLLAKIK